MRRTATLTLAALGCALAVLVTACGGPGQGSSGGPPVAPTSVHASPGPGYMTVTWTESSGNETGFRIYRTTVTPAGLAKQAGDPIGTVGPGTRTYIDSHVTVGAAYEYSVAAVGDAGESAAVRAAATATVDPGVDLLAGTINRRTDATRGTTFLVYLALPEAVMTDGGVTFDVAIAGPAGWNGGATYTTTVAAGDNARSHDGYLLLPLTNIDAVAGTYDLTVTAGSDQYAAHATLADAGFELAPPTDIVVTPHGNSSVTVTWSAPPGSVSSFVSLWQGTYQKLVSSYLVTDGTSVTFDGLDLAEGTYSAEVAPFNTDFATFPVKVDPFGASYDIQSFDVGPVVAPMCTSPDQVVSIGDTNLQDAVRESLNKPSGDLTCADMAKVTDIEANDYGIQSLDGLQYAINLDVLNARTNQIGDLGPLANLSHLEWVDLYNNDLADLGPLGGLTQLRGLEIGCDCNTILDVTPLQSLTNLENLGLEHRLQGNIAWLAGLDRLSRVLLVSDGLNDSDMATFAGKDLVELDISANQVTDLTFVSQFTHLQALGIGGLPVTDLAPVKAMTQLTSLTIWSLGLTDISFLSSFDHLQSLYASGNEITDISVLAGLNALNDVDVSYNNLTDISPLVANTSLASGARVDVSNNLLDLSSGSQAAQDVQTLVGRGVDVTYQPQR